MIVPAGARGLDYAFGRPTMESIKRNGYSFVVRYLSVPPASASKNLTAVERDQLLNAGIGILLVWEMSAATPDKGGAQGALDGASAARLAAKLGYPQDVPILAAVDTDSYSGNIGAHEAYVRAFGEACKPYRFGVYGDADILLRIRDLSQIGWLPNASGWSSASRPAAMAAGLVHVLQRKGYSMDGVAVDPNDVIRPIRVWSKIPAPPVEKPTEIEKPPVVVLPPAPTPTPPEGDDMKLWIIARDNDRNDPHRWITDGLVRVTPTVESIGWLVARGFIEQGQDILNPHWVDDSVLAGIPVVDPAATKEAPTHCGLVNGQVTVTSTVAATPEGK